MFVGSRTLQVQDCGGSFPVWLLYPTHTPASPIPLGPYTLEASPDAPPAPGSHPLVVLSHGSGSTPLVHRQLASHLAQHGYTVALPEHPGNHRNDNTLEGTLANLQNRPRHIRRTLDAVFADPQCQTCVPPGQAAVIGHSMGSYTALAVAGGQPCTPGGQPVAVEHDARIQALVLLAPAAGWFMAPGALRNVHQPILLLAAEHDPITPLRNAEVVRSQVPERSQVRYQQVENAGHFAFLTPFPPALQRPGFAPAEDPPGFDRPAFQQQLQDLVRGFLGSFGNT